MVGSVLSQIKPSEFYILSCGNGLVLYPKRKQDSQAENANLRRRRRRSDWVLDPDANHPQNVMVRGTPPLNV